MPNKKIKDELTRQIAWRDWRRGARPGSASRLGTPESRSRLNGHTVARIQLQKD